MLNIKIKSVLSCEVCVEEQFVRIVLRCRWSKNEPIEKQTRAGEMAQPLQACSEQKYKESTRPLKLLRSPSHQSMPEDRRKYLST